jgi:hypothetical protein
MEAEEQGPPEGSRGVWCPRCHRRKEAIGAAAPCRPEGGGERQRREWFSGGGARAEGGREEGDGCFAERQKISRNAVAGDFTHFAVGIAVVVGVGTLTFLAPFYATGVGWGIH